MNFNNYYLLSFTLLVPLTTTGMKPTGTPEAQQALQQAIKTQSGNQLQEALDQGADVNEVEGPFKMNALHALLDQEEPLTENQLKQLDMILDQAKLDIKSGGDNTPLHFAAAHGHLEAIKRMADRLTKEDINAQNARGWTPLHRAAYGTHFDVMRFLKSLNADPTIQDKNGNSPLHTLAQRNIRKAPGVDEEKTFSPDLVKWMITAEKNKDGDTALHIAASQQSPEMVKAIIAADSKLPEVLTEKGQTALHKAISTTVNPKVIKLLLDANIDVDTKDSDGRTALHLLAITMSDLEKIARQNNWPVEEALEKLEQIANLLKKAGISTDKKDKSHKTALNYAEGNYTKKIISSM